ncbi:MAG: response regulator [Alphaproteobacteria bacterium]|nr:response regulator [Alphaproteobacteria bacterium]
MSIKDKLRVMVVDDMSTSRSLIYDCFDKLGITNVSAAKNGADALKSLQKNPVHLVVSDYNMPEMDGLELLKAIREHPKLKKIGFILVSGSPDQTLVDKGRALGMNNYLKKPFDPRDLQKCVRQVFGPLD